MYAQGWGRIVHVSSVHGLRASPHKSAYVAAKHGLEGLSKVIALEGARHGVTSNCVNPAYVRTPLVEGQIADQARTRGIPENEVIEKVMLTGPAIKNASSSPRRWPRWPHFSAPRRRRSSTALP
jgi:3-hydroxybutyrate dehydrogenase